MMESGFNFYVVHDNDDFVFYVVLLFYCMLYLWLQIVYEPNLAIMQNITFHLLIVVKLSAQKICAKILNNWKVL